MAIPLSTIGSFRPTFVPARPVGLTVKHSSTYTLDVWLLTILRVPSRSSVTFWEETAPVKLTRKHCPPSRFREIGVRILENKGWYFTL